jgi:hypothetical protein
MYFWKKEIVMKNNIAVSVVILSMLFILFVSVTPAASALPMKGIGCWVQRTSLDNPNIYADVFGWYVADAGIIKDFENKKNKPLLMSFAGKDPDKLIKAMETNKDRISGVVWDWERQFKGISQDMAEEYLNKIHSKAKELGIVFGLVIQPGVRQKGKGIDLTRADSFADFIMPMLYVQWFKMKRGQIEKLVNKERQATRLPIIALLTIETTAAKAARKLAPDEIISIYKGLPVDGFAVWNVRELDAEYVRALSAL